MSTPDPVMQQALSIAAEHVEWAKRNQFTPRAVCRALGLPDVPQRRWSEALVAVAAAWLMLPAAGEPEPVPENA